MQSTTTLFASCLFLLVVSCVTVPATTGVESLAVNHQHLPFPHLRSMSSSNNKTYLDETIASMYSRISSLQWQDTTKFDIITSDAHRRGTWQSKIHINMVGGPLSTLLRRLVYITDDNSFSTMVITDAIFVTNHLVPELVKLNDTALEMAVAAIIDVKDKNREESTPLFCFWPMKHVVANVSATKNEQQATKTESYYRQWSINLSPMAADILNVNKWVKYILDKLDLAFLYELLLAPLVKFLDIVKYSFNMSSDSDDTGNAISLAMRWLVSSSSPASKKVKDLWKQKHFNYEKAFQTAIDNSYCPFSSDNNINIIDTRSWVVYRGFITNDINHDPDNCFITTWIKNLTGEAAVWQNKSVNTMMPFNVNNIDVTVGCNFLYGFVTAAVENPEMMKNWYYSNKKVQKTISATAKLIQWTMLRQDVIILSNLESMYYPTIQQFPTFFARLLNYLNSVDEKLVPIKEIFEIRDLFNNAKLSRYVLQKMKTGEDVCTFSDLKATSSDIINNNNNNNNNNNKNYSCWDSFLGHADKNDKGELTPHYDDRFYTTSLAVNSLLDAYTIEKKQTERDGKTTRVVREWISSHVEPEIKLAVENGISFLHDFYHTVDPFKSEWKYSSAFFSGSVHAYPSAPFNFPSNSITYLVNGSTYTCADQNLGNLPFSEFKKLVMGVRGVMSPEEFEKIIESGQCAGLPLGRLSYMSYNGEDSPWPFWDSLPLSLSFAMQALAKFKALV